MYKMTYFLETSVLTDIQAFEYNTHVEVFLVIALWI